MTLKSRPYGGPDDLQKMKALVVEGRKASPHSIYPHVGDLDWWFYYGAFVKGNALEDLILLWEEGDNLLAWVYFENAEYYDLMMHPLLLGTETEMLIRTLTSAYIQGRPGDNKPQGMIVWADETARRASLEADGFTGEDYLVYFFQPLDKPVSAPLLPEGFCFIDEMQPEWADRRADVHFNAFSPSRMSAEAYANFMTAPNYDPTLDVVVVVVAPDDSFVAFAMCWVDPQTGIGSFEPVGTRPEMQRKGLGRAVLLEGMRRMKERGMTVVTVLTGADDAGNIAFYENAGFQRTNMIMKYEKKK